VVAAIQAEIFVVPTGITLGLFTVSVRGYADGNPVSKADPFGLGAVDDGLTGVSWIDNSVNAVGNAISSVFTRGVSAAGNLMASLPTHLDLGPTQGGNESSGLLPLMLLLQLRGAPVAGGLESTVTARTTATLAEGSFSIIDWAGYPEYLPKPAGPFRLLEGAEYETARAAANAANNALRVENPGLKGWEIHEIQPVKFGGSPTAIENKFPLPPSVHREEVTPWWNQLQKDTGG
jgi:hypothetical protein